jgi:hypothetical protein
MKAITKASKSVHKVNFEIVSESDVLIDGLHFT